MLKSQAQNERIALCTRGLGKQWGSLWVNKDLNLNFKEGCRHAIIGPNGAGKTTLVHLLSGAVVPSCGQVLFFGKDITTLSQAQRVRLGISRSFQQSRLFPELTVLESVLLTICHRQGLSFRWWRPMEQNKLALNEALQLIHSLQLTCVKNQQSQFLSYGQQRLLELALVLATKPKVLLLDEPAAGMSLAESQVIFNHIAALPSSMSVILIEHDMQQVFNFAEEITVLVSGRCLVQDKPQKIATHVKVRQLYLGDTLKPWNANIQR